MDNKKDKYDLEIRKAYSKAIYCANSKTGKFHDSVGYKILKEAAYKKQRETPRIKIDKGES